VNTKIATLADLEAQLETQNQELEALRKLAEDLPAEAVFPESFFAELDELSEVQQHAASPSDHATALSLLAIRG
jgi:hypothetical protein